MKKLFLSTALLLTAGFAFAQEDAVKASYEQRSCSRRRDHFRSIDKS